jgi:hypothetical protein
VSARGSSARLYFYHSKKFVRKVPLILYRSIWNNRTTLLECLIQSIVDADKYSDPETKRRVLAACSCIYVLEYEYEEQVLTEQVL